MATDINGTSDINANNAPVDFESAMYGNGSETVAVNRDPVKVEPEKSDDSQAAVDPKEKKSIQHFQSIADQRLVEKTRVEHELELERNRIAMLQQELEAAKNPKQVMPELVRPIRPVKPADYNRLDGMSDPTSESYKWESAMEDYRTQKEDYQDAIQARQEQLQQSKANMEAAAQKAARAKSDMISMIMVETGGDPKKAEEIYDFWVNNQDSRNPRNLVKAFEAIKGGNGNGGKKHTEPDKRDALPPGIGAGENEDLTDDPNVAFTKAFHTVNQPFRGLR